MHRLGQISLPEDAVRWLGVGLLASGLMLAFALLAGRAASWRYPEQVETSGTQLYPEMVILPPGTFLMGSPEEEGERYDDEYLHKVNLTKSFAISRTEITQGQFASVMKKNPVLEYGCRGVTSGDHLPVVCVDWFEAVAFCNALSEIEGLTPAYEVTLDFNEDVFARIVIWNQAAEGYRLLTEAEWEYAARAGTQDSWVGTSDAESVCQHDNLADAKAKAGVPELAAFDCDDGFANLAPVGSKELNRWQLYDLGGNVAEWVWDTYGDYPERSVQDPVYDEPNGSYRVFRGGSWGYGPRDARVANRNRYKPSDRVGILGFRIARTYPAPSPS